MDEEKKARKSLKKAIKELKAASYQEGWNDGFDVGAEDAREEYQTGFQDGAKAERERIKTIFDMNIQWALESNKGSDVVFFTKAKQIIEPIEVDMSDEAYQRSLEADGF